MAYSLQTWGGGGGGGVINCGGMPVSHHRVFAMMPVAQSRNAVISPWGCPHLFIGFYANDYTFNVFLTLIRFWVVLKN